MDRRSFFKGIALVGTAIALPFGFMWKPKAVVESIRHVYLVPKHAGESFTLVVLKHWLHNTNATEFWGAAPESMLCDNVNWKRFSSSGDYGLEVTWRRLEYLEHAAYYPSSQFGARQELRVACEVKVKGG